MNSHNIIGTVKGDPKVFSKDNWEVCKFRVEVKGRAKYPETMVVCVWGKTAQETADKIHAGATVAVSGEPKGVGYEGKDGKPKGQIEINANTVENLFPGVTNASQREESHDGGSSPGPTSTGGTDDLPF